LKKSRAASAHALLVAEHQDVFEVHQVRPFECEKHLVDHPLAQQLADLAQGEDRVLALQPDRGGGLACVFRQKADQADSVSLRLLQRLAQTVRARAHADHQHVAQRSEFPAQHAHQSSGAQPEDAQKYPAIRAEQGQERAAEVQPEEVLQHHHRDQTSKRLPEAVAQNGARMARVEPLIDVQPDPHPDPD